MEYHASTEGVDKLVLRWGRDGLSERRPLSADLDWSDRGSPHRQRARRQLDPGGLYDIFISSHPSYGLQKLSISFNPSRILDPYGQSLCPYEGLHQTIDRVLADARRVIPFWADAPLAHAEVDRLDLAQDFENVDVADDLIRGLEHFARPRAGSSLYWRDGRWDEDSGRIHAPSLYVHGGAGTRQAVLYRKDVEREDGGSKGGPPPGTVRAEVRLFRKHIRRQGVTLENMTPECLRAIYAEESAWAGLWATAVSDDLIEPYLEAMSHEKGLQRPRGRAGLAEYLRLRAARASVEPPSRPKAHATSPTMPDGAEVDLPRVVFHTSAKQAEKYRPLQRRIGLAPVLPGHLPEGFAARLVPMHK